MKYLIPIFIISLFACSNIQEANRDFSKIVLIDTFDNELVLDTVNHARRTKYYPLYIGKYQDTISLEYTTESINLPIKYTNVEYKYPDSLDVRIFIDTTKIIGSGIGQLLLPSPNANDELDFFGGFRWRGKYKSYPVFIENISADTLALGSGNLLTAPTLEAKDSNDVWIPIERIGVYMCGTGLKPIYLLPDEIVVTHCKIYSGTYKTKLRLALDLNRPIFSNEFEGTINYSQVDRQD